MSGTAEKATRNEDHRTGVGGIKRPFSALVAPLPASAGARPPGTGWAVRIAGKGTHSAFGIMGACLALGGCAIGNLLAIIMIAARQYNVPPLDVFRRLTPDVLYSPMGASFRPMHALFYFVAILEGYRFSVVRRA